MLEGRPLKGYDLERLKEFLKSMDLDYDMGIEYSICLEDEDYRIIAAGSVEENVLKCIAISPDHQGEGLSGTIISHLTQYEFEKGRSHLLMYTKPKNQAMFEDLGFYTILKTDRVLTASRCTSAGVIACIRRMFSSMTPLFVPQRRFSESYLWKIKRPGLRILWKK